MRPLTDRDDRAGSNAAAEDSVSRRPRRRGYRKASGGRAPDPELAADSALDFLSGDAAAPEDAGSGGHDQWLREQRPPHWG